VITITQVRIFPFPTRDVLGFANVVIGNCISLNGIRIIDRTKQGQKLMVTMPSKQLADGRWVEFFNAINRPTRAQIENAVLAEYARVKSA